MKKLYFTIAGVFLLLNFAAAQTPTGDEPFYHRSVTPQSNNTNPDISSFSGTSGTGANLDVVYHRVSWTIDPNDVTKTITGTVTTHFRTIAANVSVITFDLRQSSFNNGSLVVRYHGIVCAKTLAATNILSITLPSSIPVINTLDSITINYSGVPPAVAGAAQGYQRGTPATGNYVTTLSESYEDKDWWPCKADMQDKIDSMDIFVNVPWVTPDTFWVAANGKLVDSTITAGTRTFHFVHAYPIASYLVAVSVAKFDRYYRYVNVNGTNTQVAFYLLRGKTPATISGILTAMDNVTNAVTAFGQKFGEYPFKLEKHGFYDGLLGAGGMEHQTFSAIAPSALTNIKTLIHELMHQWFGDNVSFATWNDLWLAEGFARYSEALCGELVPSLGVNPYTTRNGIKTTAIGNTTESTWIPDANAATSDLQWNSAYGTTVYERGAMIVSMLRTLTGDSVFFKVMAQYQTVLGGKSATTDTLRNYFNRELGYDISEFFRDYVGGSGPGATAVGGIGNPIYNINWGNPAGTTFRVQVASQGKTAGSNVAYFNGPVLVHVTNAAAGWTKDTTIVFYDGGASGLSRAGKGMGVSEGNYLQYTLSFVPTNVFFDDSARLMATQGTINKISILDLNVVDFTVKQNGAGNYATLTLDDNTINSTIVLERSANGSAFTEIGEMGLSQENTSYKKYNFNDTYPLKGNNYYRARYKTADGNDLYSKIIKISNTKTNNFSIVNNPVKGKVKVRTTTAFADDQHFSFMVYDASGKLVYQADQMFAGAIIELDTEMLPKGNYVLGISTNENKIESLKFVIN